MQSLNTLWRLSIRAKPEDEEAIRGEMFAVTGLYPAVISRSNARTVEIECFFDSLARARDARRQLAHLAPQMQKLPYEDWAESWKKHFPLQRVGKRLVIKPSWKTYRPRPEDIVIELDPGMSFGTGQHATTRFCLKMIERLSTPPSTLPRSFLDVGTGSGILAIAASKLGYSPVLAVDNDRQAVRVASANALVNGASLRIRGFDLDELKPGPSYDVVAANLLADLIIAQRRTLDSLVSGGGFLILAGILAREADEVARAFRSLSFKPFACEIKRNWAGFVFQKPKRKVRR